MMSYPRLFLCLYLQITASNINQIGRTTGPASQRGRSGSDPNLHIQSTLQRPKLNQTSFISQPEHIKAHNQLVNGFHSTLPGYSGDNHMTNGHVTVGKTTPIQSSNEPHISHMVNNSPQNGQCLSFITLVPTSKRIIYEIALSCIQYDPYL